MDHTQAIGLMLALMVTFFFAVMMTAILSGALGWSALWILAGWLGFAVGTVARLVWQALREIDSQK